MLIESIYDESFRNYGRVWADVPAAFTEPVVHALAEHAPCPEDGTKYEASAAALEELEVAPALKGLLFGGRPTQLGWCCGHNTRLNALEYHRSSEFNLGANDFILLLAKQHQIEGMGVDATLDMSLVRAFRVPAGVLVEVFADTLHYAPCQTGDEGFRTLVALPQGTNGPLPELDFALANAGDAPLLWAADKWLIVHAESNKAAAGAHVGLQGESIDIAEDIA